MLKRIDLCTSPSLIKELITLANVLLYGPPGTGKTEFAKARAAHCGLNLFDINHADSEGNP